MSRFIPFPAYHDFAPLDISYLFESEKPAGKHGFLKVEGDRFVFEDGTPVRFWGTNLNSGACFPEKPYAEKLAKRIAAYGCNLVRLHQIDSEWATPSIYQLKKGKRMENTSTYDPESFDRLDYLLYCLKQEGIYIYLDLMTYRKFKAGDGVDDVDLLHEAAKPWSAIDPWLIELQKEFCTQIWTHYNPYTQLVYKDDPAFVLTEIINESTLFQDIIGGKWDGYECPTYMARFRAMFRDWLKQKDIEYDWEHCDFYVKDAPMIDFKLELTYQYYRQVYDHLRAIGVKIPITGTNLTHTAAAVKSHLEMDFTDSHHYHYDWRWGNTDRVCQHLSCTDVPTVYSSLGKMKVVGKPFFVSEWDMPWPNSFRAEGPIYYAAVAALQNWSGFTIHTYAYSSQLQRMDCLGKELSSPVNGMAHREGVFATWNDPAKFGLFYHAALITRRLDITPAKQKVAVYSSQLDKTVLTAFDTLLEQHQAATTFEKVLPEGYDRLVDETDAVPSETPDLWVADNGQLWRDLKRRIGAVDTERTKIVYGFLGTPGSRKAGGEQLDGLSVECATDFGVIAMSSLTDDPICHSRNILISAIGRARNTGAQFDGDKMVNVGKAPIQAEVIEAKLRLRTSRGDRLKLWAINPEGYFAGKLQSTYEDGVLTFSIGDENDPACYYLLVED